MKPLEPLSGNSGQNLSQQESQSSPLPNPKKNESRRSKENSSPKVRSINGSLRDSEERTKSLLESGSASTLPVNVLPVPKAVQKVERQAEALKRLKVKPEQLEKAPKVSQQLKQARGGLKATLAAMRFVGDDEVIAAFLHKYDSIPVGDRETLPWEAIAISAGIDLRHLLGSCIMALANQAANTTKIIAATNHPHITKMRVKYGSLPSGEKDRTALDIMVGAQPSPKGPTFIGKAIFGSGGQVNGPPSKDDDDDDSPPQPTATFGVDEDLDQLFPPSNIVQENLVGIRQKLLTD